MKRLLVFVSLFMILAVSLVFAENRQGPDEAPVQKKFIIHLKDGGSMEARSYEDGADGKVTVLLSAGTITIDKSTIESIEEVKGADDTGGNNPESPAEKKNATPVKKPLI